MELSLSKTDIVSPLHQRLIEDMAARKLNPHTQRSHVYRQSDLFKARSIQGVDMTTRWRS